MTPEAQRISIAQAIGWKNFTWTRGGQLNPIQLLWGDSPAGYHEAVPDFLSDLNAMHKAEKVLVMELDKRGMYLVWLAKLTGCNPSFATFATAGQRAEAFLRVKGLWV